MLEALVAGCAAPSVPPTDRAEPATLAAPCVSYVDDAWRSDALAGERPGKTDDLGYMPLLRPHHMALYDSQPTYLNGVVALVNDLNAGRP